MNFNHENLMVYQRILSFNIKVANWVAGWDGKHAIRDQLSRAAESMLENVAMASAAYSSKKQRSLDYAIGSGLECAACLDLASIKRLLDAKTVYVEKEELSQVLRMLVGLRKSWAQSTRGVRENDADYSVGGGEFNKAHDKIRNKEEEAHPLFHHETLDVYKTSIEAATAFYTVEAVFQLSNQLFRRLDELFTSMVLNIAEGNGRFSHADQIRFMGISHESAIKLAARLDLCAAQNLLPKDKVDECKALLKRVSAMTLAIISGDCR
ncbi:MAG: four helix bundle protein [Kiritimatiellia bacterium]|jgi:four helix bundle protein